MSRYFLLFILNVPFILATILTVVTQYKLNRITRKRLIIHSTFLLLVLVGLMLAQPIYTVLFQNNLTQSEALSLFDVVQITSIVIVYFIVNRSRSKIEMLERRVNDLHQELSIMLSTENRESRN